LKYWVFTQLMRLNLAIWWRYEHVQKTRIWNFGSFTQEIKRVSQSNWQVAYDVRLLNSSGSEAPGDRFPFTVKVSGEVRVAFFFHYLKLAKPLLTPVGPLPLPKLSPRPARLDFIKYQAP
jgi:hypothetical protein